MEHVAAAEAALNRGQRSASHTGRRHEGGQTGGEEPNGSCIGLFFSVKSSARITRISLCLVTMSTNLILINSGNLGDRNLQHRNIRH